MRKNKIDLEICPRCKGAGKLSKGGWEQRCPCCSGHGFILVVTSKEKKEVKKQ